MSREYVHLTQTSNNMDHNSANDPYFLHHSDNLGLVLISWLLNSISKEMSASVIYLNTAEAIWKEFKERFQQSYGPRIFQIKRDLMNLVQGQDSVSTYFTKLKFIGKNWQIITRIVHMAYVFVVELEKQSSL